MRLILSFTFSAYIQYRHKKERERLLEEHRIDCENIQGLIGKTKEDYSISDIVRETEEEEMTRLYKNYQELHYYEEGLKTILDIYCSPFKRKDERIKLQDHLMSKAFDSDSAVGKVVTYDSLQDIYRHDTSSRRFCSNSKEDNGKLRQLYVQQWKTQLERDMYRNIIAKLKRLGNENKNDKQW